VTFEVVDNATSRGKSKLTDNLGFSYIVKVCMKKINILEMLPIVKCM